MLRSLYSGAAGLLSHRTRMDVIGNNIANVNTTAYKTQRTEFQDVLYQTLKAGGASRNYAQVGTGVDVAAITANFTQGALQSTGRTLDLAIQGEGFFVLCADERLYTSDGDALNNNIDVDPTGEVTDTDSTDDINKAMFTRDGVFYIDKDGYIVNAQGYRLLGQVDGSGETSYEALRVIMKYNDGTNDVELRVATLSIGPDGKIRGKYTNGENIKFYHDDSASNPPDSTYWGDVPTEAQILIATFPNKEGLKRTGQNLYEEDKNVSGEAKYQFADGNIISIASGYLEMSNVDLADQFVDMIKTQRGFQANARTITVSDTLLEELVNLKR